MRLVLRVVDVVGTEIAVVEASIHPDGRGWVQRLRLPSFKDEIWTALRELVDEHEIADLLPLLVFEVELRPGDDDS